MIEDRNLINDFANKWYKKFCDLDINYVELIGCEMADDCKKLGFEMDCGTAFYDKYGEAINNFEELGKVIEEITDVDLLGSAIFSQWRYFNHWAYSGTEMLEHHNRLWFILALERMRKLTQKGEIIC